MQPQRAGSDGAATTDGRPTDRRRAVAVLSIVVVGLVLAAIPIYDVYEDAVAQGDPVWTTLIENAVPFALAAAISYVGVRLRRRTDVDAAVVAGWCLTGALVAVGLTAWVLLVQSFQSRIKPLYIVLDSAIVGTLAATLVGLYDAHRRRQRAVIERQRDQLEFLARVLRHDLLNDMNVVSAEADILAERVDGETAERVESIRRSTDRMIDLTTTARSVMQSITDGEDVDLEPVDLAAALSEVVADARERRGLAVTTEYDPADLPAVAADDLLGELFANLVANAAEHAGDDPTVWVDADVDEEGVTVTVADDGPGVPEHVRSEAFEQGASGRSSDGTGIGLFLVATLTDRYGGDVWIDDDADYPGATFRIRLPRA